ncbi:MAG: SRPBCC family protein [Solirubrobacterales bacterium]|nr:SRPBCC family protein [Solirubrobacterales bacterium]
MAILAGTSTAEIDAPIEQVWKAVEDVAKAPDWQGGMKDLHVLETDGDGRAVLAETEADAKVTTVKTKVRFSYDGPSRLSWRQEKGDLKSMVGSWDLEDLGDGRTRVTYSLEGDTGRVLGMLIRGPVEDKLRGMLVNARADELKAYVEGG